LKATGFYEFRPVGGGDFSEQIYIDADSLSRKGLVSVRFSGSDGGRRYRLTPAGAERAKKLEKLVRPELTRSLRKLVSWVRTRSMDQLLRGSTATAGAINPNSGGLDSARSR
jgi:DNA-binding PadR family transcriptional regulator